MHKWTLEARGVGGGGGWGLGLDGWPVTSVKFRAGVHGLRVEEYAEI